MHVEKRLCKGWAKVSAHSFKTNGLIMSQPIAFCGSSCARASYTSSSVNEMLLNYRVGTCREETGGSLKLLLVKVELKNLLNSSAFCRGSRTI